MKIKLQISVFISVILFILFASNSFGKGLNGPEDFYKKETKYLHREKEKNLFFKIIKSPLNSLLNAGLTIYQYGVSDLTGTKCSMYPSCSHYSREALKKHGSIIGIMMTTDRLIHEAEELERGKIIKIKGSYYIYDPIEANDFWWSNDKK